MATKKKTSKKTDWLDDQVNELNDAFADKEFQNTEPVVVKGSHLTVTTWPNGRTELKWDDEALLRDVQQAVLKYESNIPAANEKPKRARIKGKFAPDDKATPVVNEAWVGGKSPAKKTVSKMTAKKKTKK